MQCSAVQCSAVQCSAAQRSAAQRSAVHCSAVQCSAVQCSAQQINILSRNVWPGRLLSRHYACCKHKSHPLSINTFNTMFNNDKRIRQSLLFPINPNVNSALARAGERMHIHTHACRHTLSLIRTQALTHTCTHTHGNIYNRCTTHLTRFYT